MLVLLLLPSSNLSSARYSFTSQLQLRASNIRQKFTQAIIAHKNNVLNAILEMCHRQQSNQSSFLFSIKLLCSRIVWWGFIQIQPLLLGLFVNIPNKHYKASLYSFTPCFMINCKTTNYQTPLTLPALTSFSTKITPSPRIIVFLYTFCLNEPEIIEVSNVT